MDINELGRSLEQNVGKNLEQLSVQVRPQIEKARQQLQSLNGQATDFIKAHPAACLLGAVGLGYLIARVARRHVS
jgi:hypothetical protein